MRQGDGSDLLGAHDARGASIGIIYVAPTDDRSSVLEAILMQDKLGRKQVAVVLPENSRAFQRPVDFDGLKNMRRGLKTEIIFVASGVPGPAEFARQRRFTVYTSLESYTTALRAEAPDSGNAKKGLALFARKPKLVPNANAPAPLEDLNAVKPPQPLPASVLPVETVTDPLPTPAPSSDGEDEKKQREPLPIDPFLALGGAGIVGASLATGEDWLPSATTSPQDTGNGSHITPASGDGSAKPVSSRPRSEPIPIPLSMSAPQPKITAKLPATGALGARGAAAPPVRSGNTGKRAAVGIGAASVAAFAATGQAPVAGGGLPPTRGNAGGGGGGGGGGGPQRRSTRRLLAILLIVLTLLLLAGIAFASPMGQGLVGHITGTTVTATVTITPDFQKVSDKFVITAVTGTPDPKAQQVQARILSYTSPSGTGSAGATGSIAGANATGTLTFANIGNGVQVSGGTLTGASGVPISFGSFFLPFGSVNVQGTAVNQGRNGNIPALDINGSCCNDGNIRVRNGAFGGGRDPVPNSIITQNDITSATNKLISSLTPAAQTSLQQQVKAGEQVVNKSLQCKPNTITADHNVGDQAKSVTVKGTVTCTEEVYDQKAALDVATNALRTEAAKNPGAGFALVGNVVTNVASATVVNARTVSLEVAAQGVWVYQFTDAILNGIKNKIAKEPESKALTDVQQTPGVKSAEIKISSGTTMPDAANITINVVKIPGASGSPTPGSGSPTLTSSTTPASTPAITPTSGLGGGPPTTPTVVLGGS